MWEEYLEKIQNCTDAKELKKIRDYILYEEDKLNGKDMFLLAEFIEFKRHYL